ncbi:BrnA antitoxin family protein [Variovorax sp. PCZ-1]|uniref:BrnA antitoxin family protein n=1 Tax=Variovorax sp. PCZ-1 TaxID=2835533 RepID=UPI0020BE7478|nr:BrnA antitoxin family protein [Variovorax sp. PCZ-1]
MTKKILGSAQAWEERALGADEQFAAPVPSSVELDAQIDDALALRMISIRLPETLIEDFKNIATVRGGAMGYQTLMRQALKRFATSELKLIAREMAEQVQQKRAEAAAKPQGDLMRKAA